MSAGRKLAETKAIVVLAAAARTTTATSSSFRIPADATAITFITDQNTVTGTSPTSDLLIEMSHDDSTWFGVARFTQQTSALERFLTVPFITNFGTSQTHSTNWLGGEGAEKATTGGVINDLSLVPFPFFRVIQTIGGTNPSFNGQVIALVKAAF